MDGEYFGQRKTLLALVNFSNGCYVRFDLPADSSFCALSRNTVCAMPTVVSVGG